jgi:SAM-dependent methyltransferase
MSIASLRNRFYPGQRYGQPYFDRVTAALADHTRMLVFGAGRGLEEPDWRTPGRTVVGVDVDPIVHENPKLDEAVVYGGSRLPFPDASFDCCTSNQVLEHLADPGFTLREIARVLRPGGRLIFKTSNKHFYPFLIAALIPERFHAWVIRMASGRAEQDSFPTHYYANSRRDLRTLAEQTGFRVDSLRVHVQDTTYLTFSVPSYLVGVAIERLLNSTPRLEDWRHYIVGDFVRA